MTPARIECRCCGETYPQHEIARLYSPLRRPDESGICRHCYYAPECPQCAAPVDEAGLCAACHREVTA